MVRYSLSSPVGSSATHHRRISDEAPFIIFFKKYTLSLKYTHLLSFSLMREPSIKIIGWRQAGTLINKIRSL